MMRTHISDLKHVRQEVLNVFGKNGQVSKLLKIIQFDVTFIQENRINLRIKQFCNLHRFESQVVCNFFEEDQSFLEHHLQRSFQHQIQLKHIL
jgi:hypothetical protein